MHLLTRLIDLVTDITGPHPHREVGDTDGRTLAIAALLVHVARIDGTFTPSEHERVIALLGGRLGLSGEAAARLLERAERLDHEVDDLSTLIEMLGHRVPLEERRDLLAMAYVVAGADGQIAEFEDDLVWRMAGLLGIEDGVADSLRAEALARPAPMSRERA